MFLILIQFSARGQALKDSLQSFVKEKSRLSDSYFITFEPSRGYPLSSEYLNSKTWGEVYVMSEAFVFEVKDTAISSWRFVDGVLERDTIRAYREVLMLSNRNGSFSEELKFKEIFSNIYRLGSDRIMPGIAMEVQSNGDTLYRELMFMHTYNYDFEIWRAGKHVMNYQFEESCIMTKEDPVFNGQLINLNYKYNLGTLQYKLFEWVRKNSVDAKHKYIFL
jgi:hypothetical protein